MSVIRLLCWLAAFSADIIMELCSGKEPLEVIKKISYSAIYSKNILPTQIFADYMQQDY